MYAYVNSTIEGLSTYSYDATSQVTAADHNSQTDETYSYDLNGNRNSSGYTTTTNNRTTAGGGFTYVYDDEGNRTSRTETATGKVQEYSWDHRNRLITVKERNSAGGAIVKQVDYVYDALNRLVKRTYDADGAGAGAATNQYWAYDEGINALVQFDGNAASNLSHRYLWSDMVDEILADEVVTSLGSGGNVQWPLGDHLGTVRDIADLNEGTGVTSVTNHRTYNAYGKLVAESNAAVDLIFGFTGKQLDDATGLQHNLFRWYDSNLGQWLSEDPLGFAAGDENVRRYVKNSSLSFSDQTGLYSEDQIQMMLKKKMDESGLGSLGTPTDYEEYKKLKGEDDQFFIPETSEDNLDRLVEDLALGFQEALRERHGFDCEDYAMAMYFYLTNALADQNEYQVQFIRTNNSQTQLGHMMTLVHVVSKNQYYIIDAREGVISEACNPDDLDRVATDLFNARYRGGYEGSWIVEKTWTNLPYYENTTISKMFIDVLESRLKMKEMTKAEREKILGNYFPKGYRFPK